MHYFALLLGPEPTSAPDADAHAAEMAAYEAFHAKAASAIRAGDTLAPSATGVRITSGPDAPTITDGPFAESAEVAGGYYVFEAENLDEALALARDIPAAKYGAVEVWPTVFYTPPTRPVGTSWLALLWSPRPMPTHRARRNGMPALRNIRSSVPPQATAPTAARHCIHPLRQRRCGCATTRSW